LTLSKIRKIKKEAFLGCTKVGIEASTVALGVINFERLCLKGIVTKANRKVSMAVSLLLAFKFNEPGMSTYQSKLQLLLDFFDRDWEVSRKDVFEAEFGAYVKLGFSLHVPHTHVHAVYMRLLRLVHKTSRQYLQEDMHEMYVQDVLMLDRIKRQMEENQAAEEEAAAEAAAAAFGSDEDRGAGSEEHGDGTDNNNMNNNQNEDGKAAESGTVADGTSSSTTASTSGEAHSFAARKSGRFQQVTSHLLSMSARLSVVTRRSQILKAETLVSLDAGLSTPTSVSEDALSQPVSPISGEVDPNASTPLSPAPISAPSDGARSRSDSPTGISLAEGR
jgi:hypothetical protein